VQEPGLPLSFDGVLVIVGGGTLDTLLLRELASSGAHLVGADAGGDAIAAAGLQPEAIIGDLDSLSDPAAWDSGVRVLRVAEQDTTDFEKALYSTRAPVTVALGMTGGRFDHTLAALDAVLRHARERHIILVDTHDLALALTGPFSFEVGAGERVSIHPLGPVRFESSSGLAYPLDDLLLAPGVRLGTSNAATDGGFTITPRPDQPPWLLILDRRHLKGLLAALA
jgi:thiamine pyrophosphokinase